MQLHIIIGEDDFLVDATAKKIVGDGVGLELYDSREASNAELQLEDLQKVNESVMTPPFFDPKKTTWWKNVHFLPGGKCSADIKEALENFAERLAAIELAENQQFILSGPQLLKTSVFAKTLAGKAEIITFSAGKPWEQTRQAEMRANDLAADEGMKFAPGVAAQFITIVGTDTRSMMSEMGKLRCYLGAERNEITAADVQDISSPGVLDDPVPWDVTDAVGARDLPKALAAMKRFELENGFAVMMSGQLEKLFRNLLDVKRGRTAGMAPFVLKKNTVFAEKWSETELRVARARFLQLREKAVSGTVAGDVLVVTELIRSMRRVKR